MKEIQIINVIYTLILVKNVIYVLYVTQDLRGLTILTVIKNALTGERNLRTHIGKKPYPSTSFPTPLPPTFLLPPSTSFLPLQNPGDISSLTGGIQATEAIVLKYSSSLGLIS